MKILVVSNLYPPDTLGGYERGCRQAVHALRERGHDVRVLTSAPRTAIDREEHDVHRRLQLAEVWSNYLNRRRAWTTHQLVEAASNWVNAVNVHALLDEIDDFRPDVAYLWMLNGLGGLGLLNAIQLLGLPWVWHLMDDVPSMLCQFGHRVAPPLVRGFNQFLRGRFICCSQQLADEIETSGVRLNGELKVITNWVTGPRQAARSQYMVDGTLRIVTASALIATCTGKGTDLVVEAAARLREEGFENFAIDVYGTVLDESIPELIRRHDLESFVRLKGLVSQDGLQRLLLDYDVFAFPTREREPNAFAPLEASARGCVPIISDICGNAEWLVHGVHLLKAARHADAVARVLQQVLEGEIDIEAIGRRGAAVMHRDFHIDRIVIAIESFLQSAAHQRAPAGASRRDVYRMALLAERLSQVLIQEPLVA